MKKVWTFALVIYLVFIITEIFFGSRVHYEDNKDPSFLQISIDYFFSFSVPIIQGVVVSFILSVIPYKQLTYKTKFHFLLPFAILIMSAFTAYAFLNVYYFKTKTGRNLTTIRSYDTIIPDARLSCSTIKDGKFSDDRLVINRNGSIQVQTDIKTLKVTTYRVNWISNCEYLLENTENHKILKVKVVEVTDEYYDCYYAIGKNAQKGRFWIQEN